MKVEFNVRAITGSQYDSFGGMADFFRKNLSSGCGEVDVVHPNPPDNGEPWKIWASGSTDDYSANTVRARLQEVSSEIQIVSERAID